jgi:hypothetical protein
MDGCGFSARYFCVHMLLLSQDSSYYFIRIAFKVLLCWCALYVHVRVLINYGRLRARWVQSFCCAM